LEPDNRTSSENDARKPAFGLHRLEATRRPWGVIQEKADRRKSHAFRQKKMSTHRICGHFRHAFRRGNWLAECGRNCGVRFPITGGGLAFLLARGTSKLFCGGEISWLLLFFFPFLTSIIFFSSIQWPFLFFFPSPFVPFLLMLSFFLSPFLTSPPPSISNLPFIFLLRPSPPSSIPSSFASFIPHLHFLPLYLYVFFFPFIFLLHYLPSLLLPNLFPSISPLYFIPPTVLASFPSLPLLFYLSLPSHPLSSFSFRVLALRPFLFFSREHVRRWSFREFGAKSQHSMSLHMEGGGRTRRTIGYGVPECDVQPEKAITR